MSLIKFLVKLALAALIVNATWRVGTAYAAFYRFRDAVEESTRFSGNRPVDALRQRVLDLANQFDLPLTDDGFTVKRVESHIFVDGEYTEPIAILPGYEYPWTFSWASDVVTTTTESSPRQ